MLLNIDKVSGLLEQLGVDAQVRGLVDSGWFLENKQQKSPDCPDSASCTPVDAIKKGLRYGLRLDSGSRSINCHWGSFLNAMSCMAQI